MYVKCKNNRIMKTIMYCVLMIFGIFLFLYLMGSYILTTFNISEWTLEQRLIILYTTLGLSFVAIGSYLTYKEINKNGK